MNNQRHLTFVYPYAFGTGWGGATPRILHLARGLAEHGWALTLLRCKQANEGELASVCAAFPGNVITAPFNGPYPALFNRKGWRKVYSYWLRSRGRSVSGDPTPVLAERLLGHMRRATGLPKPDMIWGITVGFLSGPTAAQKLAKHYGSPFIVEFQDPVPHPGRSALQPDQQALLNSCLADASLVVTTTHGISNYVQKEYPAAKGKTRTVYLTYDDSVSPPASTSCANGHLVLAHAGVLYGGGGRNATSLVQAIAHATRSAPALAGHIRLRLIGAGAGGVEAADLARTLGIPWAVEVVPQIPPEACLAEMDRADVLVAIKFDDAEYDLQIPGKIFQYLGRGKPILGLMRETEAARILRSSGLGTVKANSDIPGISDALLDFWSNRSSLAAKFQPNWNFIHQFSCSATATALDSELSTLLPKFHQ